MAEPRIITFHAFRRGTGKSHLAANVALALAGDGHRVGLLDLNLQSPSAHVLFGIDPPTLPADLNRVLREDADILAATCDVTPHATPGIPGAIYLVPASATPAHIIELDRVGYSAEVLSGSIERLVAELDLDVILLDTQAGLNETTLLAIALSDVVAFILHPDQQHYQGTAMIVGIARELETRRMGLIVNNIPTGVDPASLKAQFEEYFMIPVIGLLPYQPELQLLASEALFTLRHPTHPLTFAIQRLARNLAA